MSAVLRLAHTRHLKRNLTVIARNISVNHEYTKPEWLTVNCFIPRTTNIPTDRVPFDKRSLNIPEDYKVIYKLPKSMDSFVNLLLHIAIGMLALVTYSIIDERKGRPAKDLIAEQNNPDLEEELLSDNVDNVREESVKEDVKNEKLHHKQRLKIVAPPMVRLAIALLFATILIYIRSVVVLTIYRKENNFVTVFHELFSSKSKVVEHSSKECYYFPHLKMFQHQLLGKYILVFPDLFQSTDDEDHYATSIRKK